MQKRSRAILWSAAAAAVVAVLALYLPLIPLTSAKVLIKIPRDAKSAAEIAAKLKENGVLRHPRLFRIILKLGRWDTRIHRGTYALRTPEPWPALIRKLVRGETYTIKVNIPEGWRSTQIAQRLVEAGIIKDPQAFMRVVEQRKLEGVLFPSTYFLEPDLEPQIVARILYDTFRKVWQEKFAALTPPAKLTPLEVLTLASIVERETSIPEEMPLIAGVYLNRLKKRWRLEADPTVQYALGYWKSRILYKDLNIKSPYNTYRNVGLPPGPICNPGERAIAAVFFPAQTEAMYFVARPDGSHIFSKTLADHNKAKAEMLKKYRSQQKK